MFYSTLLGGAALSLCRLYPKDYLLAPKPKKEVQTWGGVNFLVWAKGKLLTSKECLELGIGGHICMAIVA